jgi:tyrosinase
VQNIAVFGTVAGKRQLLGQEAILSRWHMDGCANCQLHTGVRRSIPLHGVTHEHVDAEEFKESVEIFTRGDGVKGGVQLKPKVSIVKRYF